MAKLNYNKTITATEKNNAHAYSLNPIWVKPTHLGPYNNPGMNYFGPAPDAGTTYGMWQDQNNDIGVLAPIPDGGTTVYSPLTGDEMQYLGPATKDALDALYSYTGAFEFLPPNASGETCLTSAPIFTDKVETSSLFNPFTGDDLSEEYKLMKANRTKPASEKSEVKADVEPQKVEMKEHDAVEKPAKSNALKSVHPDTHKEEDSGKLGEDTNSGGSDEKGHKAANTKADVDELVESMSDQDLSDVLAAMRAEAAEDSDKEKPEKAVEDSKKEEKPKEDKPQKEKEEKPSEPSKAKEEVKEEPSKEDKAEEPTPTTRKEVQSMKTTELSKEFRDVIAKLSAGEEVNPDYLEKLTALAETVISKKSKKSAEGGGFYDDKKEDVLDDAQKKNEPKGGSGNGFYDEHKLKVLKQISKVEAMIDAKLEAIANAEGAKDEKDVEDMDEAAAKQSDDLSKEDMESAMHEIEHMLHSMQDQMGGKKSEEPEEEAKEEDEADAARKQAEDKEEADAMAALKAEISKLQSELSKKGEEKPAEGKKQEEPKAEEPKEEADAAKKMKEEEQPAEGKKEKEEEEPAAEEPKEEKAEGVAWDAAASFELLTSVEELEAEGPVTASAVRMALEGEGGINPFWNVMARGEPVARIFLQDQPHPDEARALFVTDKYATHVAQAIEKIGLKQTLASLSAKLFANKIDHSAVVQKVKAEAENAIKVTVAQKTATLRDHLLDCLMVAATGLDKNMFRDEGNPLKDALYVQMKKFGVGNPVPYIESAFDDGSAEYFKVLLAKAIEFMDMEPKALSQVKKSISNAATLAPESIEDTMDIPEMPLASRLAEASVSSTSFEVRSSFSSMKDNLKSNLGLSRKR